MSLKYLALGDSYTIGEQVEQKDNFPNQTVEILKTNFGIDIQPPEIIAVTGWTTGELITAIASSDYSNNFDLVTLLIGVNNQYRGQSIELYAHEFEILLERALLFAQGEANRVFVLSIPDWGVTPFAKEKKPLKVYEEINAFNEINHAISKKHACNYIDITSSTRKNGGNANFLTPDLLHYSKEEYENWAKVLSRKVAQVINGNLLNT